jgi:hypothetical protein
VAIYRLLQQSAFGPEFIDLMVTAYEDCLRILQLSDRSDPLAEVIAKKIIEIAQTGVRDPFAYAPIGTEGHRRSIRQITKLAGGLRPGTSATFLD